MNTVTFDFPTLIHGKKDSFFGGVFDAMLNEDPRNATTNAELTIYMRLHIYDGFTDPKIVKNGFAEDGEKDAAGNNLKFEVTAWPAAEFTLWKKKLISTAQAFWHGRFWLQTPSTYKGLDWPKAKPTHRPNVWCRFELEESAVAAGANFSIGSIYLGTKPTRNKHFRSNLLLYDSDDPLATKRHEVGHLLGLDHPGGRNNTSAAYVDRPGFPSDIMGGGTQRHPHHALPWQRAMAEITGTKAEDWKAFEYKVFPKLLPKT